MELTKQAQEITNRIYKLYGSDSGYLFGFSPEDRKVVETIIQLTLNMANKED